MELKSFETSDSILTKTAVRHIIKRHFTPVPGVKKSLFCKTFPLAEHLKTVASYAWEPDCEEAFMLEQGYCRAHGYYRIYVFSLDRHVGWDPEGFSTKKLAVYYSEKNIGDKWKIVSCYPWTSSFDSRFRAIRGWGSWY